MDGKRYKKKAKVVGHPIILKNFTNALMSNEQGNRKRGGKKVKNKKNYISTLYTNFVCDYF